MKKIAVDGVLYEAVNFNDLYANFKTAIDYLQNAKNTVTDKNQLRTIKSCQAKIKKAYNKIKQIESSRYAAKFRPLTDEERLRNLKSIDSRLEKQPTVSPGPKRG